MDLLFKNNPTLLTQIILVNKHTDLKKNEQGNVKTITMNKNQFENVKKIDKLKNDANI